jgi:polysaccharide export outer membrane protein
MSEKVVITRVAVFFALALSLLGCTTVPGTNISGNTFALPTGLAEPALPIDATLIKLTPQIVSSLTPKSLDAAPSWNQRESGEYEYQIGVGDVLSIVVWDHPELTAPFGSFNNVEDQGNVVREDGSIFYPFVGDLSVEGKTAREVQKELAAKLANFIESPQLDVRVVTYRSQRFFVTGMVEKPGTFPVTDVPVRVVEALGLAGGVLAEADLFDVTLSRNNTSFNIPLFDILYEGDISGNALLRNGDVLHIAPNELRRVFVMGEVVRPSTLPMTNRRMSLTQALGEVGGIQEARADGRGIYVIRDSEFEDLIDVYQLDTSEAWALALGDQFILQPRDIVYVSAAPITRWNRWVSNVLPSLQGLYNLDRINTQ